MPFYIRVNNKITLFNFSDFPHSLAEPFNQTSPEDENYNCIAWAYGDSQNWYWPTNKGYLPSGIPRIRTLQAFIELFESIRYKECGMNGDHEDGYEKIAIYCNAQGLPTHAARQLKDGLWTSKLGNFLDVSHSIQAMSNGNYGDIAIYMKRLQEQNV